MNRKTKKEYKTYGSPIYKANNSCLECSIHPTCSESPRGVICAQFNLKDPDIEYVITQ